MNRRQLLKAGALVAAVTPAAAWRRASPGTTGQPAAGWAGLRQPGSLPDPRLPAGTDTIPPPGSVTTPHAVPA